MQTPDSSNTGLPTGLTAALGCLDVTLEDELALYRNQKNVKLLALSGHEASTEEAIAQHTRNVIEDSVPSPSDALDQDLEYQEPEVVYAELEAGFAPQEEQSFKPVIGEGARDGQPVGPDIAANSTPGSSLSVTADQQREMEQALTHVKPEHTTPPEESAPPATTELPTPYGVEGNPLPESFEKFLDPSIDDYLESSEGLLKHLENSAQDTEERVQQSTQKSWKIAGLLGLGVGVLLSGIWLISGYFKPPSPPPEIPQQPLSPSAPTVAPQVSPFPSLPATNSPVPPSPAVSPPQSSPLAPSPTPVPNSPNGTTSAPTTGAISPPAESPAVIPPSPAELPAPTEPPP
jgi:hypothetical protein